MGTEGVRALRHVKLALPHGTKPSRGRFSDNDVKFQHHRSHFMVEFRVHRTSLRRLAAFIAPYVLGAALSSSHDPAFTICS
ncbi:hypothetical protein WMF11_26620 [Sorangium sp. So ce295]|uniref:hypothetical protein n=1 Tax=Sorangium sp. So ce295 TaxID=3133295 RepID=UPI003F5FDC22